MMQSESVSSSEEGRNNTLVFHQRPQTRNQQSMEKITSLLYRTLMITSSNEEPDAEDPNRQRGETSTLKLPPEILSTIFHHLGRNSKDAARVTAVCTRWRAIAIHCPYLWTTIIVQTRSIGSRQLKRHLSGISLALDRTGGLPLDVEWHSSSLASVRMFYTLFREKGTFDRWRTLSLDIDHNIDLPFGSLREVDKFSNLNYLKLMCNPPKGYLNLIFTTAITNLDTLELASKFRCSPTFHAEYSELLERITTLTVWSRITIPVGLLPQNVTNLHVYTVPSLPIPHVRHLFVTGAGRELFSAHILDNLVTLSIHNCVEDHHTDFPVTLPNLIWLGFKGNGFVSIGSFIVPSLHTLSIRCSGYEAQTIDGRLVNAIWKGFEAPKLLMLFLDMTLDGPATFAIMKLFPEISRVDLYFPDAEHGHEVLSHIFPKQRDLNFCPKIDVLRAVLFVPPSNEIKWKESVAETAGRIGEPFWLLESKWEDGRALKVIGNGRSQKVDCVHPWIKGG